MLPKLNGSQKQIDWANQIRETFIDSFADNKVKEQWINYLKAAQEDDVIDADNTWLNIMEILQTQSEAKWFIDNLGEFHKGLNKKERSSPEYISAIFAFLDSRMAENLELLILKA